MARGQAENFRKKPQLASGKTLSSGLAAARSVPIRNQDAHSDFPTSPGQVTCEVFQDAKPAMQVYTLRKRKETYDGINELTMYDRFPPASEHS